MGVKETSDEQLIFDLLMHERVILKYHTDSCGRICQELKVVFDKLAVGAEYKDIKFLRINADNNPVARKYIEEKKQPIMNIYLSGNLIECRTVGTKQKVEALLDRLMQATPDEIGKKGI